MTFNEIIQKFSLPDKTLHKSTTSLKFKLDVYEYFYPMSKNMNIAEFGSWCGFFTQVFSDMFNKVYSIDNVRKDCFLEQTKDLPNVEYIIQNLYGVGNHDMNLRNVDVIMIDAVHTFSAVMSDTRLAKYYMKGKGYLIYDDYGAFDEIKQAIDTLVGQKVIKIVKYVGHEKGWSYKEGHELKDWEGVIATFDLE